MNRHHRAYFVTVALSLAAAIVTACSATPAPTQLPAPASATADAPLPVALPNFNLCWVAYSPTEYDPTVGRDPLKSTIREDIKLLYSVGFRGVITYAATGALDHIPQIAREEGMEQVIVGIWDPLDEKEVADAMAIDRFVDGYIVGNEGLGDQRYTLDELTGVINHLRSLTGKPVTTTERLEEYSSIDGLIQLGDWLSPTVHPYWYGRKEPAAAAEWTAEQFDELQNDAGANRAIQFKEVGLPTNNSQDSDLQLSEAAQADYYRLLQETNTVFAYFEAFDQPWKIESGVGPHWGLFHWDRTAKPASEYACGRTPPETPTPSPTSIPTSTPTLEATLTSVPATLAPIETAAPPTPAFRTLVVYDGVLAPGYELNIDNSSHTYGWLADTGSSLKIDFLAGQSWAVVYITVGPPLPDGQPKQSQDLSTCQKLIVDLRAERDGTKVEIGMKDDTDLSTGPVVRAPLSNVNTAWQSFSFALSQFSTADLTRVYLPFEIVYFGSETATVYLDNIRFVCAESP